MRAKLSSVTGVVVVLAVLFGALGLSRVRAQEPETLEPTVREAAQVEPAAERPGGLGEAARLLAEGRHREAAVLVERILNGNPHETRAWELYFQILFGHARELEASGDYVTAVDTLAKAIQAVRAWRGVLVGADKADPDAVLLLVKMRDATQQAIDSMADRVIDKARALYAEGKGESWYNNDDEGKFIEALVLLDSQRIDLLSADTREAYASIWTRCYAELGTRHRVTTGLESAITHGRHPYAAD